MNLREANSGGNKNGKPHLRMESMAPLEFHPYSVSGEQLELADEKDAERKRLLIDVLDRKALVRILRAV